MLFIYSKSRSKTKQTKNKASIDVSHNFGGGCWIRMHRGNV